jgi:hypothetical protein
VDKETQRIMAHLAGWVASKLAEDWDQPIIHDILDHSGMNLGPARNEESDLMGQGAKRLEDAMKAILAEEELVADKAKRDEAKHEALRAFFSTICNKKNWKLPINATIFEAERRIAEESIIFMTGGGVEFYATQKKGRVRVKAPGYYENIGS